MTIKSMIFLTAVWKMLTILLKYVILTMVNAHMSDALTQKDSMSRLMVEPVEERRLLGSEVR